MVGTIFRVLLGLIAANLAAGLVQAFFIVTPADLAALRGEALTDSLTGLGTLALLAATQSTLFAGPLALTGIVFAEWQNIGRYFIMCRSVSPSPEPAFWRSISAKGVLQPRSIPTSSPPTRRPDLQPVSFTGGSRDGGPAAARDEATPVHSLAEAFNVHVRR